jgi:hypothetical protein
LEALPSSVRYSPPASRWGSSRRRAAASRSSRTAKCRCGSRSSHRGCRWDCIVTLNGGVLNVVDGNGKVLDVYKLQAGKAMWLDADKPGTQHADVNPGKEPVEVIVVQLKNDKPLTK